MQGTAARNDFALKPRYRGATFAANSRWGGSRATTRRSVLTHSAALLVASFVRPRAAFGQAFPSKPIKIIVTFPAGGPADSAVRIPRPGMDKLLGQSIIIESVSGVAGLVRDMDVFTRVIRERQLKFESSILGACNAASAVRARGKQPADLHAQWCARASIHGCVAKCPSKITFTTKSPHHNINSSRQYRWVKPTCNRRRACTASAVRVCSACVCLTMLSRRPAPMGGGKHG